MPPAFATDMSDIKQSPSFGGQTFDLRRKSLEKDQTDAERQPRVSSSFMASGKTLDTTRIVTDLQEPPSSQPALLILDSTRLEVKTVADNTSETKAVEPVQVVKSRLSVLPDKSAVVPFQQFLQQRQSLIAKSKPAEVREVEPKRHDV
jgi:hypothetical protein